MNPFPRPTSKTDWAPTPKQKPGQRPFFAARSAARAVGSLEVLPAANTSGLSDQVLSLCHSIAPFGIVLLDASLASKLSEAKGLERGIEFFY